MKKALKLIGRVLSAAITALLAILLCGNLYTIAARALTDELQPAVFGWSTAVVISGSMSGEIEVNDMVVIHREKSYDTGDVITFESNGSLVTHRIVDVTDDGFVTKGDANNAEDLRPIPMENVVGRVVLVIPRVGAAIEFLRTPLGMMCLVLVGFAMIELPIVLGGRKEEEGA